MCVVLVFCFCFFFFKQKTAYEMRISDWSADVCSSDLVICVLIIRWYMTETDFLDDYDPTAFERPSVTVDLVLLGLRQGSPTALLVKRQQNPFAGQWALPGGFVRIDEAVDDAAKRILHDKAGIQSAHLEQLYTFGSVNQTGTFLGMRAALPVMAAHGGGSIAK